MIFSDNSPNKGSDIVNDEEFSASVNGTYQVSISAGHLQEELKEQTSN